MQEQKLEQILLQISNLNHSFEPLKNLDQLLMISSQKSTVAEVLLSILPLAAITLGGVLFFFFLLWEYKLRKILINSGEYKANSIKSLRILSLLFGINGILLGAPLALVLFIVDGIGYSILGGLIPFSLGLGMLTFYSVVRRYTQG